MAGDVDPDIAEVQRNSADDVGDRIGGLGVDRNLGGERIDLDRRTHEDHAEIERAHQGRINRRDRERRAMVGTRRDRACRAHR